MHRVPPHREHHRVGRARDGQNYQALEERYLRILSGMSVHINLGVDPFKLFSKD